MSNTQKTNLEMIQQSTKVVCVMANDAIKRMDGMNRTPEELKKGLECCRSRDCTGRTCPYYYAKSCSAEKSNDAFIYIQQLEAQVPHWISVEERLPEEKELVLVHYTDGWMPIAFLLNGNWYNSGGERSWLSVTHWMPLPQAPKEG